MHSSFNTIFPVDAVSTWGLFETAGQRSGRTNDLCDTLGERGRFEPLFKNKPQAKQRQSFDDENDETVESNIWICEATGILIPREALSHVSEPLWAAQELSFQDRYVNRVRQNKPLSLFQNEMVNQGEFSSAAAVTTPQLQKSGKLSRNYQSPDSQSTDHVMLESDHIPAFLEKAPETPAIIISSEQMVQHKKKRLPFIVPSFGQANRINCNSSEASQAAMEAHDAVEENVSLSEGAKIAMSMQEKEIPQEPNPCSATNEQSVVIADISRIIEADILPQPILKPGSTNFISMYRVPAAVASRSLNRELQVRAEITFK